MRKFYRGLLHFCTFRVEELLIFRDISRITNSQFSWLKLVLNDFSLVDHGYNFVTKKNIRLVHQKRKLATTEINKCLFWVCQNSCIHSCQDKSLWFLNLKFTKISSSLAQRKMNPWKLAPPTSSTTKSFETFSSHEKKLGKPLLSEFRTNEKDC